MDRTVYVSRNQKPEVRSQKNLSSVFCFLFSVLCSLSSENEGITLIELLIAAFLVGLVGIAVTSVDISARRFMFSAQQSSGVQNEASPAVEHIMNRAKNGWFTLNDGNDNGSICYTTGCDEIFFTIDIDTSDGVGPLGSVTEERNWYKYQSGPQEIQFRSRVMPGGWGPWETIAQNITACAFKLENVNGDVDTNGNNIPDRLTINITAQTTSLSGETKTIKLQSDVAFRFSSYRI